MRKPASTFQKIETEAVPSVNWKLLNQAVNQRPQLMWSSVTPADPVKELDSRTLPLLKSVEARYWHNKKKANPDSLLGCKVFWEEFRRSQLVIIFDRFADDHLLRRIYQELEANGARTMQTLMILGGTMRIGQKVLDDISEVVKETNGRLKFEHLPGMKSNTPPFPHDRFAITNGEFWHFGGTVAGEMGLSGISRGWKAADIGVQKFMEDTWTVLKKGTSS